jgi:hypothetical protein
VCDYTIPLGTARVLSEGTDVTLVGWGAQVLVLAQAAKQVRWHRLSMRAEPNGWGGLRPEALRAMCLWLPLQHTHPGISSQTTPCECRFTASLLAPTRPQSCRAPYHVRSSTCAPLCLGTPQQWRRVSTRQVRELSGG